MEEKKDETKVDETTEETTVNEQEKNEKTFKQSDLDQLIQTRLKREKDGFKKQLTEWEEEKTSLSAQIEKYEKTISNLLADRKSGLSETEKKLIEKLTIEDQLEFLLGTEPIEKKEVQKIPELPKAKENTSKDSKPANSFRI